MTIRETAIAKLQQLPESLLQEVSDFIDLLVIEKSNIPINHPESERAKKWARWFESLEQVEIKPTEPISDYQEFLLDKYRQQGLEL
ncbi:MAG: hypothetical protein KME27_08490 [Lyngbya sp. HA4199-MV5]|jgi:hypothetical protein|nr:hypothetical protein [Lyngbya sp. HA4199-MV5]